MGKIVGCGTALVTPFSDNFSVDYDSYRSLVRRQIESGVDFLVVLGTTAEVACLDLGERIRLIEITLEEAGDVPVLVGVGTNCTQQVVDNIKKFELVADYFGYLVVAPYYNKPNQHGLLLHYKTIANATRKNIILYNIPGRTGININVVTVLQLLAQHRNIVGIKEASSNYGQIGEIIEKAPRDFVVLSGNDDDTLPLMAMGAKGVISTVANLVPKQMKLLTQFCLTDDFRRARELHYRMRNLFVNCFKDTNPQPIKGAMAKLGLLKDICRLPMVSADEALVAQIVKNFEEIQ